MVGSLCNLLPDPKRTEYLVSQGGRNSCWRPFIRPLWQESCVCGWYTLIDAAEVSQILLHTRIDSWYILCRIRLQLLQPSTSISLNVTVYPQSITTSLNQHRHVLTSGAYDDTIAGVATPQISVAAGKYYVVPSTYNPGAEVGFKLIVYSSIAGLMVSQIVNQAH